ncbi:uncharacterized protein LOC129890507 [Solanum dulcamara]|uniref:uncharacterized protein LOC129890507 n=1 Tax=Solanum dulcamara TaxID=45834 RepID=UPI0024860388|nr:uncharacterized protein LOC129890507 [Solanum dulcamara]
MAPYEDLLGRRCGSPIGWFKVGDAELIGLYLVHQAMENVNILQETLKTAQSHQKSYTDVRRRDLEFEKCLRDSSPIVPIENVGVNDSLSYEEIPIQNLDRQVHKLTTKDHFSQCLVEKLVC